MLTLTSDAFSMSSPTQIAERRIGKGVISLDQRRIKQALEKYLIRSPPKTDEKVQLLKPDFPAKYAVNSRRVGFRPNRMTNLARVQMQENLEVTQAMCFKPQIEELKREIKVIQLSKGSIVKLGHNTEAVVKEVINICENEIPPRYQAPFREVKWDEVASEIKQTQGPCLVMQLTCNLKHSHFIQPDASSKSYRIGRSENCEIRVNQSDLSVSRVHALLKFSNGKFEIIDNRSKFGTVVEHP